MGTIQKGILGGFSGKVGTVVGGTWKSIDYMRSKASSVSNPRTEGQLNQRAKFATVLHFLQPLTEFLRTGFKLYANKMTQFNSAMSYNLNNAITGTYPDFSIDLAKVLVSRGHLSGASNPLVNAAGSQKVEITWDNNSGVGNAKETDQTLVVLYCLTKAEIVAEIRAARRTETSQEITVPQHFVGEEVEAFISFISEDGKEVSNSLYLGSVTIA